MNWEPRRVGESLAELQARTLALAEKSRLHQEAHGPTEPVKPVSIQEKREGQWQGIVPRRFWGARLEQLDAEIAEAIGEWADSDPPVNLVISGPTGPGKTHAAVAALRVMWERRASVVHANVVSLLAEMRPGGDPDAFTRAASAAVLLLDDVGALRDTDWTDETMYRLIDLRWSQMRPVVVTTNLTPEALKVRLDDRVYERLCLSGAVLVAIKGESRRRG